jgi:hypothetical protein
MRQYILIEHKQKRLIFLKIITEFDNHGKLNILSCYGAESIAWQMIARFAHRSSACTTEVFAFD